MPAMRLLFLAGSALLLAVPALAGDMAPAARLAAPAAKPMVEPAARHLPQVRRRLRQDQIAVARLQRDVARQESASRQAGERLRRQDQAIADLQRQLQQLLAAQAGKGRLQRVPTR